MAQAFLFMKKIKKILRVVGLVLLILLALSGVGIIGNFNRERYMDKRVTTEQVDKKDRESEEGSLEARDT